MTRRRLFERTHTEPARTFTLEQFDNAARAIAQHITGEKPQEPFTILENDHWYVLARVVLEGAGLRETP